VRASQMGLHGFRLLREIDTYRPKLSNLPSVQILWRVWDEQFEPGEPGNLPDLRERRGRAPGGRVESPYDPEARYRSRYGTHWTGYVVHLSETCDAELPRVITHAHTTAADVHEARCTGEIHTALAAKDLTPADHLADAAYVSADHLVDAKEKQGIRLVGPTRKNSSWQAKIPEAFDRRAFKADYQAKSATCPEGKTSASWLEYKDESRGRFISARFSRADCQACYYRILRTKGKSRNLLLHPDGRTRRCVIRGP